ncbi:hypothetical protein PZ78_01475 [Vreelandella venusta]|nr:hypothetical protein PZ78_01475 [Halomonas hydrothermalis]
MGFTVYVTDNIKNSPAKTISDYFFDISIRDIDAILEIIKEHKIQGVLCGFTDSVLPYYRAICQKAHLPCYISNDKQIEVTTNKEELKTVLKKFEIPYLKSYLATEISTDKFPIIVKPADNSGGRGVQICHSADTFLQALQLAEASSPSKKTIIEKKIDSKEATAFYYMDQGKLTFLGLGDRIVKKKYGNNIPLPVLYRFPSDDENNYLFQLDNKVRALINHLEIKNGLIYLQTFNHKDGFIVYELAHRLTGSLEYKIFECMFGINAAKKMAKYSVGQPTQENTKAIDKKQADYYNLTISCEDKDDIFYVDGLEEISALPNIIYLHKNFEVGEKNSPSRKGTLEEVIFRVLFSATNDKDASKTINKIKKILKTKDKLGNNIPYFTY